MVRPILFNPYHPLFSATFTFRSCILANFALKLPNFLCHSKEGRYGVNFGDIVKLCDFDNTLIGATFLAKSYIS